MDGRSADELNKLRQCLIDFVEPPLQAHRRCFLHDGAGKSDHLLVSRRPWSLVHEIKGGECLCWVGLTGS